MPLVCLPRLENKELNNEHLLPVIGSALLLEMIVFETSLYWSGRWVHLLRCSRAWPSPWGVVGTGMYATQSVIWKSNLSFTTPNRVNRRVVEWQANRRLLFIQIFQLFSFWFSPITISNEENVNCAISLALINVNFLGIIRNFKSRRRYTQISCRRQFIISIFRMKKTATNESQARMIFRVTTEWNGILTFSCSRFFVVFMRSPALLMKKEIKIPNTYFRQA